MLLVLVVAGAVAVWSLRRQWVAASATLTDIRPRTDLLLISAIVVLATYALLVELWRRTVSLMNGPLNWWSAARMWTVSGLARYLPGSGWQLGALGALAREGKVSAVAAGGAAVVLSLINSATGVVVAVVGGARVQRVSTVGVAFVVLALVGTLASPLLLRHLGPLASRLLRRDIRVPRVTFGFCTVAVMGNAVAWVGYGVAFRLLDAACFPAHAAPLASFVAAYAGSYVLGLFSPTPAGIGVSDSALVALYHGLGIGTTTEALAMTVVVRVWRTLLEIAPGAVMFLYARARV